MEKPCQLMTALWLPWLISVTLPFWLISAAPLTTVPPFGAAKAGKEKTRPKIKSRNAQLPPQVKALRMSSPLCFFSGLGEVTHFALSRRTQDVIIGVRRLNPCQ
jgi:hypothetical protein